MMMKTMLKTVLLFTLTVFFSACAVVRTIGEISQAIGDKLVHAADKEEK
jgi:predicted small secreted protein